jgi:type I restriction enzyme S subunit
MAGEWREVAVEELKAQTENALATGPFGSSIGSRFFTDFGVPVIRGSNLSEDIGTRLNDDGIVFLSPEKAQEFSRSTVRDGDLVFTCWGTVNQVGLIDRRAAYREYIISNKQMKLTPDPASADSLFLYYLFSSPELQDRIKNQSIGSSVPGFNLGQLRRMLIRVPEVEEQRAIANILGTLDDKIELNRRMTETLEAMARAIFKSWFVDFDPVRAKVEGRDPGLPKPLADLFPDGFEDSELGEIPAGWAVGCVDDEFALTMGQSPPGDTYNETGEGLPFYQGRADFSFRFPTRRVYCTAPTRLAKAGDTLISVRAPVGDINMASEDCAIGRGVAAARHRTGSRSYSYQFMRSLEGVFARFEAEGTVFGSIGKRDFHALSCVVPPRDMVFRFERAMLPIDSRIEVNERESGALARLRDTLLSKLIFGELRVNDAERFIGGATL